MTSASNSFHWAFLLANILIISSPCLSISSCCTLSRIRTVPGWKTRRARCMLGMKVCRRQIKLVIGHKSLRHFRYRGAIAWPQTGIDHQSSVLPHHDADVGPAHDGPNVFRHLHGVLAQPLIPHRRVLRERDRCHKAQRPRETTNFICRSPTSLATAITERRRPSKCATSSCPPAPREPPPL